MSAANNLIYMGYPRVWIIGYAGAPTQNAQSWKMKACNMRELYKLQDYTTLQSPRPHLLNQSSILYLCPLFIYEVQVLTETN